MNELKYNRNAATAYAEKWAFKRNPKYLNFDLIGGDCTNFASQCVYAGSNIMNPTKTFGWYYYNANNRTASWTGVQYIHNFLVANTGIGPYAIEADRDFVLPGDLLQLGSADGQFYHCPVIVAKDDNEIYVAAHTDDSFMRPLSTYYYDNIRFIHILGVRRK